MNGELATVASVALRFCFGTSSLCIEWFSLKSYFIVVEFTLKVALLCQQPSDSCALKTFELYGCVCCCYIYCSNDSSSNVSQSLNSDCCLLRTRTDRC